jgi:hypothetical protein
MGLVSFLVPANEMFGTSGVVNPAAASVRASRREMLFPEADDRPEAAAANVVRSKFIVGFLIRPTERPA